MLRLTASSIVAIALLTAGCASNNRASLAVGEEPYQPKYSSLDSYEAPASTYPTTEDTNTPPATYEETPAYATNYPATTGAGKGDSAALTASYGDTAGGESVSASFGRTHVVSKGDTLIKLSRYYYGNDPGWKDIWEANRNRVPNPNQLPVGMKLIIP